MWSELARLLLPAGAVAGLLVWLFWRKNPERGNPVVVASPVFTRLCLVAGAVYFAAWLGVVALGGGRHSKEFDAQTGHTYAWNSHGIIYLTRDERLAADFLEWTLWISWGCAAICGGILLARQRRIHDKKYMRP